MTIKRQLQILAALFMLATWVSGGITYLLLNGMVQDGRVVNYAGIVRGGSQRLVKLELAGQPADALLGKIDTILHGLMDGNAELQLPAAANPEFSASLDTLLAAWDELVPAIQAHRSDPANSAELLDLSETFFSLADQAVSAAEAASNGNVQRVMTVQISLIVVGLALAIVIVYWVTMSITRPIEGTVRFVSVIAGGDLTKDLPAEYRQRTDEIGALGTAIQSMTDSLRTIFRELTQGVHTLTTASGGLLGVSEKTANGAHESSSKANMVAAAAEEMSVNSASVAAGVEQAAHNLNSVATATEEMTSTIGEIARNSEKARATTLEAAQQADKVSDLIRELEYATQEIGKVTETITSISAQTNLLALNATIEAARAGAAGKGFAVVANEIKALAQQTASATGEIKARISSVQDTTASAVGDIGKIVTVIKDVNDLVVSIATAIEEQSVVTRDIAQNIAQASIGAREANQRVSETASVTQNIASEITGVSLAARDMTAASGEVQSSAAQLAKLADGLNNILLTYRT